MADEYAFNPEKCDLTPVTRIPKCERLLSDPTVEDPPEEINDCGDVELQSLPPEVPCPDIGPTELTEKSVSFAGGSGTLSYGFTRGDGCDYELDIDLDIDFDIDRLIETLDVPCPAITPQNVEEVSVGFGEGTTPGAGALTVQFQQTGGCDYDLELGLKVPCPDVTPQTVQHASTSFAGNSRAVLTYGFEKDPAGCAYEFVQDLNIVMDPVGLAQFLDPDALIESISDGLVTALTPGLPTVGPGGGVGGGPGTASASFAGGIGNVTYVFVQNEDGDYVLDIDLAIALDFGTISQIVYDLIAGDIIAAAVAAAVAAACPTFNAGQVTVTMTGSGSPAAGTLTMNQTPEECEFTPVLALQIPQAPAGSSTPIVFPGGVQLTNVTIDGGVVNVFDPNIVGGDNDNPTLVFQFLLPNGNLVCVDLLAHLCGPRSSSSSWGSSVGAQPTGGTVQTTCCPELLSETLTMSFTNKTDELVCLPDIVQLTWNGSFWVSADGALDACTGCGLSGAITLTCSGSDWITNAFSPAVPDTASCGPLALSWVGADTPSSCNGTVDINVQEGTADGTILDACCPDEPLPATLHLNIDYQNCDCLDNADIPLVWNVDRWDSGNIAEDPLCGTSNGNQWRAYLQCTGGVYILTFTSTDCSSLAGATLSKDGCNPLVLTGSESNTPTGFCGPCSSGTVTIIITE
jgi:hypothetical protein